MLERELLRVEYVLETEQVAAFIPPIILVDSDPSIGSSDETCDSVFGCLIEELQNDANVEIRNRSLLNMSIHSAHMLSQFASRTLSLIQQHHLIIPSKSN